MAGVNRYSTPFDLSAVRVGKYEQAVYSLLVSTHRKRWLCR